MPCRTPESSGCTRAKTSAWELCCPKTWSKEHVTSCLALVTLRELEDEVMHDDWSLPCGGGRMRMYTWRPCRASSPLLPAVTFCI